MKQTIGSLSPQFNAFLKLSLSIVCFCKRGVRDIIDKPYSLIVTQIMHGEGQPPM
jgi:hypothetical protein